MKNSGVKVKIRRELLSPDSIYKHQNYSNVLRRHERHKRFRRALRLFIYSLAAVVVVLVLVFGTLVIYKQIKTKKETALTSQSIVNDKNQDTVEVEAFRQ